MKTTIQTLFIVIAVIAGGDFLSPQFAAASQESARRNAYALSMALEAAGFNVRELYNGTLLGRGQSVRFETTLRTGYTYKIAAAGCEDAYDVDVRVYDENGNLIDSDDDSSNLAMATVIPAWTGTYHIVVTLYRSAHNGAHVFVEYAYSDE
jgi:hypothetical protein